MTIFVISHNLQIESALVPPISAQDLADEILDSSKSFHSVQVLNHPHWLVQSESSLSAHEMAVALIKAWKQYRQKQGHTVKHHMLALGGRKDTASNPGSPLSIGSWGVDVVECSAPDNFLKSINWSNLKAKRSLDAVFEVRN
ncbi:DUF2656 family protein [Synechococcus sp. M16CYN]|uniref:DUF2656 family protein n=1 Tax=Synechococcus sp. M16CYN TaxID=3103139 RepID=UPI00324D00BC